MCAVCSLDSSSRRSDGLEHFLNTIVEVCIVHMSSVIQIENGILQRLLYRFGE
jgi:hypothetical protein